MRRLFVLGSILLMQVSLASSAKPVSLAESEIITIHYTVKPPYLVAGSNGEVTGLTGDPINKIFITAGLHFRWAETPVSRGLAILKENEAKACVAGLFKSPEREAYAKFTAPVFRDSRYILIARDDFPYSENEPLSTVLKRVGVRVFVKQDNSYGKYIDELMARHSPAIFRTTLRTSEMLAFIRLKRADFMFVTEDEAAYYFAQDTERIGLKIVNVPDTPAGELRYVLCSQIVSDEIIQRLNIAITSLRR